MPLTNLQLQQRGIDGPAHEWLMGQQTQSTAADGSFAFLGVAPGEYALSGYRFGQDLREYAWMAVPVFDDVEGLVVRLGRAASVKGRLLFEGTAPESVARLQVRAVPGGTSASNPSVCNHSRMDPLFWRGAELGISRKSPYVVQAHWSGVRAPQGGLHDNPSEHELRCPMMRNPIRVTTVTVMERTSPAPWPPGVPD